MVQYEALVGQGRERSQEGVWPTGRKQKDQGSGALSMSWCYRCDGSGGLPALKGRFRGQSAGYWILNMEDSTGLWFKPWILKFLIYFLNWSTVDLQCCVNFCCTAKWFSYTYIHILFYILFHYSLSQDTEYSSIFYTVGPCCLSILYIIICIC